MIPILLEQNVFAPIASVRVGTVEVLSAIQLDGYVCVRAQQVHFHLAPPIERDWQFRVESEAALRFRQCLQSTIKESLGRASCPFGPIRVQVWRLGDVNKQVCQRRIYAVARQAPNAGRILALPLGINWKWNYRMASRARRL